jgi:hypothetical protein
MGNLLPKIPGAKNIRQYRPICLIDVIFKIITKILTIRNLPKLPLFLVGIFMMGWWRCMKFYMI